MFKIDPTANRIKPLEVKRFSDLGFTERKHLQEWLENHPQSLAQGDGNELLIIQKEFDGFDDTRERLALLAIDKDGNLVIGRDVVWQALKSTRNYQRIPGSSVVANFATTVRSEQRELSGISGTFDQRSNAYIRNRQPPRISR